MALETFNPQPGPAPGTRLTQQPKLLIADFGDGYTQRAADGLNALKQQWETVAWQNLTKAEAVNIEQFFEAHQGGEAFYWTPPGYQTQRKFIVTKWSRTYVDHDIYTLEAELIEVKDLAE